MRERLKAVCTGYFFMAAVLIPFINPAPAGSEVLVVPETIRVGLVQSTKAQEFQVQGKYRLVDSSKGHVLAEVKSGERWQARFASGKIEFARNGLPVGGYNAPVVLREEKPMVAVLGGNGTIKKAGAGDALEVLGSGGSRKTVRMSEGSVSVAGPGGVSILDSGSETNLVVMAKNGETGRYRGDIEFRLSSGGFSVINELPLEEYLYGVVPREMPAHWPMEALKAQAVVSRSYVLSQLGTYASLGFDILDNQLDQVYGGYNGENPNTCRAVDETRGQVLACLDQPIRAFFHSSSGGTTENSEDVWQEPLPYIRMKPDPQDANDKHYNWEVVLTQQQLVSLLAEKKDVYNAAGKPEIVFSQVSDLEILERTASGLRVKKIRISGISGGKQVSIEVGNADRVRRAFGLKSSLFEMSKETGAGGVIGAVRFKGSGWGHGLGMSQYGAMALADKGYNYQAILQYYYSNVSLKTLQ